MSGYNLIQKIRKLEDQCDRLGFTMAHSRHGYSREFGDVVALKPKDQDSLPIYARDAELFIGTINELEVWLRGLEWARDYDRMLSLSNEKKRERKEKDWRNQRLLTIIKNGEEEKK